MRLGRINTTEPHFYLYNLHYEQFPDGTVECIEEALGYELPFGWTFTTIGEICSLQAGKFVSASDISSVCLDNMYPCYGGNGIRGYVEHYSLDGDYPIIGRQGALCGNVNMAHGKFYATEHAVVVTPMFDIDLNWLFHILVGLNLNQYATGAAQPGLAVGNVLKIKLPLPPANEQKRIAETVNEALGYIEKLNDSKNDFCSIIELIKSKILDLAIRGKLVPQNLDDEPAAVLLERIRAEKEELIKQGKIKRDKKESVVFKGEDNSYYEKVDKDIINITEEIPFAIPENWCWCRLNTLCIKEIKRGKAPKYTDKSNTLVFAQKCNTKKGSINISLAQYLDENVLKKYLPEFFMKYNDIVINSTGTGTLGRVGIFEKCDDIYGLPIVPDSHITTIRVSELIVAKYIYALLKLKQPYLETAGEGSTNQKELRPDVLSNVLIPLPPVLEQKQIVATINTISKKLDNVEYCLN